MATVRAIRQTDTEPFIYNLRLTDPNIDGLREVNIGAIHLTQDGYSKSPYPKWKKQVADAANALVKRVREEGFTAVIELEI